MNTTPAKPIARGGGPDAVRRVTEVARTWEEFPGKDVDEHYNVTVDGTEVTITRIEEGSDEHASWVDVWTGGDDPSFRICNPPLLVPDPSGDVVVEETDPRGRTWEKRYRKDPINAIAQVIAGLRRSG